MPLLIDGWNFISSNASDIQDDENDSLDSVQTLIAYLTHFQRAHADPIILVLDSAHEFLDLPHTNTRSLTLVATRNADMYIKKYIDATAVRQRRTVRVVSSDKSIYRYAGSAGATALTAEEFWEKL